MAQSNLYDIIIIGSGPAGASAAIYAGRAMLRTLLIDSGDVGGQIRITSEVVNYPGIPQISGKEYSQNLETQIDNFGVERLNTQVLNMDLTGDIKTITTSEGDYQGVGVIISTGAQPRPAGFEGENTYRGRGVSYCATCDGEFFTGMDVFVVGGGFAAAEEAEFLARYAKNVNILIRGDSFTCPTSVAEHVCANPKVKVHYNTEIVSLTGDDLPRKATLQNTSTGERWDYEAPEGQSFGVFVFVGYEPLSQLFEGVLAMDDQGYLLADEDMKSNIDGVHIAGDIRPKKLRQLVTAVSDGAIAATELEKYVEKKKRALDITIEREKAPAEKTEDKKDTPKFFSAALVDQLTPILERFAHPVKIVTITQKDDEFSSQLTSFVEELGGLNEKLTTTTLTQGENPALEKEINPRRYPVIAFLDHNGKDPGIHYHALPSGHEFNSFVLALYNTAGPGQTVAPDVLKKIQALSTPLKIEVGMSLTCTMCPEVVQGLQQIAGHNPNITVDIIDVFQFPEFKSKYNIMSVPAVVINDSAPVFGKKTTAELVDILAEHSEN